jgi:hypothetical protein
MISLYSPTERALLALTVALLCVMAFALTQSFAVMAGVR